MTGFSISSIEIYDILLWILAGIGLIRIGQLAWKHLNIKGVNEFLENLKKYIIPIVIVLLLVVSVIAPIVARYSGFFDKGRPLQGSDLLGFYGAVIGGVVTVLGVYWTLKHESEKSKEERRENSLPILRFNFISNPGTPDEDSEYDIHLNKDLKQNDKYEIVDKNVIYNMEIRNIGLQPAILSSISLLSDDCWALPADDPKLDLSNVLILNDSKNPECKINLIILLSFQEYDNYNPQQIPEEKDHRRDYLLVVFEDLYSNKYKYKIPIVDKQIGKEHYFLFETDEMPVLPLKIEKK